MKNTPLKNVRIILVTPFIFAVLAIFTVIYWGVQRQYSSEVNALAHTYDKQLRKNLVDALSVEAKRLEGFVYLINKTHALEKSFIDRDRTALLAATEGMFSNLKTEHKVTHFYFIDKSGEVFLRVHAPQRHGDVLARKTFSKAMETQDVAAGIEFGVLGQFVMRVVVPWRVNGEVVGYIELGEEIDHVLDAISYNNDFGMVLSIDRDFLNRNGLFESDYFKIRKVDIDPQDKNIVVYRTVDDIFPEFRSGIDNYDSEGAQFLEGDDKNWFFSQVSIANFGGEIVGSISYIVDESELLKQQKEIVRDLGIYVGSFSFLICCFYILYSGFLHRYLKEMFERLEKEIADRKSVEKILIDNKYQLEEMVKERDESLDESRRRYKTLFDKTADALLLIEGNEFVDCNQATLDMLGYASKEELYQTHPSVLSPEVQPDGQLSSEKADLMIKTAFKNGSHRFEWDHKRKTGEVFPVEVLLTAIPYGETQLLHVVWRDITDRKKAAEEIEFQALYDSLTNLPNRRLLFDRLTQSLVAARRHNYFNALLFVDVDRFKTINDTLGHSIGDALLVESARRIQECLGREDTASRFGGDEFVVLLRHVGENKETGSFHAEKSASKIMKALSEPLFIHEHEFHITVSIGIALFPNHEETVDDIIKHADTAMYSAKEQGRNRVAFYLADMHERVMHRLNMERDLRKAVKEKQLQVYYQPQVDLDGKVVAVEALVRWHHEEHGFVSPDEFIPVAEETGIIFDLGDFVLKRAASDIVELNNMFNRNISLAVNISQKQFDKEDFLNEVHSLIENLQLERNLLTLEVTEGLAINNLNRTIERFSELRHLGVRLSLDDFGTGYSSLSHLKRLPLDELKIDKDFVFDILEDPQDAQLVKTIISIAHQFGLKAVAEGVETKEVLAFLESQGCDIIQGYFYSRPLPYEDLKAFIQDKDV